MNICCKKEDYEYIEVVFKDGSKHIKATCKVCHSYIGYIKKDEVDVRDIRKIKSKPLL